MEITQQKLDAFKKFLLNCEDSNYLYDTVEPFVSDDGIAICTPWREAGSGSDKVFTDAEMVEEYGLANIIQFVIDNINLIDNLPVDNRKVIRDDAFDLDWDEE